MRVPWLEQLLRRPRYFTRVGEIFLRPIADAFPGELPGSIMEYVRSTRCGSYTVTITAHGADDAQVGRKDGARALKELAEVLSDASESALRAAVASLRDGD